MWFAALAAKAWFKPAVWLLVILGVALAFIYTLHSYGSAQYQLGRSDKANEVLLAQQEQLKQLIVTVNGWSNDSTINANQQATRLTAMETAAKAIIDDAANRVLLVPGPDGKCAPTEDWRNSWNKLNSLPAKRK